MVFIISLLIVIDLQVFNTWGYRIDATPLYYLKSPKEAWASVSSSPIFQLILSFILLLIVASYIVYRVITKNINSWVYTPNRYMVPLVLVITAALIIPIRGGFQLAPMNQSTVYFSNNNFANIAAVNATWNFFGSLVNGNYEKVNPFTYLPKEELTNNIKELYSRSGNTDFVIKKEIQKPNVLLIVWESFTQKVIAKTINGVEVTPNFNRLKKEGIYFSNCFASGDRTDKGLPAILSGYPAQPINSIIIEPNKSAKLPVLSKNFEENGYSTSFYYGGEAEFANIKSYLYGANFQRIITKNDFESKDWNSKWGAHDHVVFNKLLNELSSKPQPFFSTMLTLSSHEPFEIPRESKISGDDETSKFFDSMNYADESLGEFIESAKKQPWWQNTIVIIVADHGHRLPETNQKTDDFRIPMLWLGGALNKTGVEIGNYTSQIDIASTLLHQLGINSYAYNWSKNIFDQKTKQWAFYCFNNGFGFTQPQKDLIFDNVGKKIIQQNGIITPKDIEYGKSLMQRMYQDYLDK
jgi:phosphoglycerol transferase MdoB-like AlkP superfamily enzyme